MPPKLHEAGEEDDFARHEVAVAGYPLRLKQRDPGLRAPEEGIMALKRKSKKPGGFRNGVVTGERLTASPASRDSFREFLDAVKNARLGIGFVRGGSAVPKWPSNVPRECLYRGHEDGGYTLLPTLIRSAAKLGWQPVTRQMDEEEKGPSLIDLQDLESQLFYEFLPRASKLAPHIEDDWDVLFLMRHHGVATRLIDWSQTLGVAIYFALLPIISNGGRRDAGVVDPNSIDWRHPHIWLLNPYRLNAHPKSWNFEDMVAPRFLDDGDESYGDYLGDFDDPGMELDYPVAVYPEVLNDRLNAQRGVFTLHGDIHEPMEDLLSEDILRKVELPLAALPAAIEFLEDAGLTESVLFPDLDSLARDIHRKYRL